MRDIAADTFAAAVTFAFNTMSEYGLNPKGPLLNLWFDRQSDDVRLSMIVDDATAHITNGHHKVLADVIGSERGESWGVRIAVTGHPSTIDGDGTTHWSIDYCEVHAPALSLIGEASPRAVGSAPSVSLQNDIARAAAPVTSLAGSAQASMDDRARLIVTAISCVI